MPRSHKNTFLYQVAFSNCFFSLSRKKQFYFHKLIVFNWMITNCADIMFVYGCFTRAQNYGFFWISSMLCVRLFARERLLWRCYISNIIPVALIHSSGFLRANIFIQFIVPHLLLLKNKYIIDIDKAAVLYISTQEIKTGAIELSDDSIFSTVTQQILLSRKSLFST